MNYDYNNSEGGVAQAVTLVTYATPQLLWQSFRLKNDAIIDDDK